MVPGLIGSDEKAALEKIGGAGLTVGVITSEEGDWPAGTVIEHSLREGERVRCDAVIDLVIAKRVTRAPEVTGHNLTDAKQILAAAGLRLGRASPRESPVAEGTIVEQAPVGDSIVAPDSTIDVWIAVSPPETPHVVLEQKPGAPVPTETPVDIHGTSRPASTDVPAVLKYVQAEGINRLRVAGRSPGRIMDRQSPQPAGTVVDQKPSTSVPRGNAIDLWTATAPPSETVIVPDIRGRDGRVAADVLQAVRLTIGPVRDRVTDARRGTIVEQKPAPGTAVPPGTPVSIWLAAPAAAPAPVAVPDLRDSSLDQALTIVGRVGLRLGTVTEKRTNVVKEAITSQFPVAGTRVPPGTSIDVVLAVPSASARWGFVLLGWAWVPGALIPAIAAAWMIKRRWPRPKASPRLVAHADAGVQLPIPGDGRFAHFALHLAPHADRGVQTLEQTTPFIAGDEAGHQVLS